VVDHHSSQRLVRMRWATLLLSAVPLLACSPGQLINTASGLASGTATVRGQIYWPDCPGGGPGCPSLEDMPIHFSSPPTRTHAMTTSDASGAYSIQLHPGTYVVIAGHADRSVFQRQLTVKAGDTVTLDLAISPATGAS
jgi:hypothetical protein